jgi:ABC-2 type transport system permease protein
MKTIYKIAKTELKTLFYSPIAWLIIVIFTFQVGMIFTDIFAGFVRNQALGWKLYSATLTAFAGFRGVFTLLQQYLFLYIPLLTMGVMSREFSSGSIKLLYSSPLTSAQIVYGKYLALVFFALALTGILSIFGIYAAGTIVDVDIPAILTGLFGLFLLICAYAAIGLFMSSLTSYTVVSAMGTLAIFAVLNYVKDVGQEIEFVRDITYWLAISGRSDTFISGLITSEDLLYFLVVIAMFLSFTIIKIQAGRQKSPWYITFGKYASVVVITVLIGYFSSKPKLMSYYDVTRTKVNTLTKSSQEVLSHLKQGMTITTYTNMLEENYWVAMPYSYKYDVDRFKQYLRFKPEIKLKYTYYYHDAKNKQLDEQYPKLNADQRIDTLTKISNWTFKIHPYKDIQKEADLAPENFRFVRSLKLDNGKQTFLRVYNDMMKLPSETEITAAFKRLTMDKLPTVGFLTGHGERGSNAEEASVIL